MKLTVWLNNLVIIGTLIVCLETPANAQQEATLTLAEAQKKAAINYPLAKQKDIIRQTEKIIINNLLRAYLPQLSFNAQGTYQSEVTQVEVPIPGIRINAPDKDQYRATADVNQLLFDGGSTEQQRKFQHLSAETEAQRNEVELYKTKERVNQTYLSILFLNEQLQQINLVKKDLEIGLAKLKAQVANGIAFKSNLDVLQAEYLKANQRQTEVRWSKEGLLETLGLLMGEDVPAATQLKTPVEPAISEEVQRPELTLFNKQLNLSQQQSKIITARNLPKISLFGQGGYGKPGLNVLKNEFDWFYLAGLRLNWNIANLYTAKGERKVLDLNKQSIEVQREVFLLNTKTQQRQQVSEIKKYRQLIEADKEILELRQRVKTAAKAQLENGVITANDYLREINAEDQARQTESAHQLQLLQAQINYQNITGK